MRVILRRSASRPRGRADIDRSTPDRILISVGLHVPNVEILRLAAGELTGDELTAARRALGLDRPPDAA